MAKKIKIRFDYSGWESMTRGDNAASIENMQEAIEGIMPNGVGFDIKVKTKGFDFGSGEITVKCDEDLDEVAIIEAMEGYCEAGYDNNLGGYYSFEII